jgi:hypothetical protein
MLLITTVYGFLLGLRFLESRDVDGGQIQGADKSLARPRRKQATATEVFDIHISYL